MAKIYLFMMVSTDGYFEGKNHDLSWHNVDNEFNEFAVQQTGETGTLLFGRKTYELMSGFWPTEHARQTDPVVAEQMNTTPKIVFSKTLASLKEIPHWENARLVKELVKEDLQQLKTGASKDIAIFGSNALCVSMMELGLVDEFRLMVNPVALGEGSPLFGGLHNRFQLELFNTRTFKSGNVLLYYRPAGKPA